MTKREQLISEIALFCASKRLSEREFSEVAVQNPKFMRRLRRNIVTSRSMELAESFLEQRGGATAEELRSLVEIRRQAPATLKASQDAAA